MSKAITFFTISQASPAVFDNLYIDQTFLCEIHNGTKIINCPINGDLVGNEGDLVIFAPNSFVTLQNRPTIHNNYHALGTYIPDDLITTEIKHHNLGVQIVPKSIYQEFRAFDHWKNLENIENLPQIIREKRLAEPILWLQSLGYKFLKGENLSPINQIRMIISSDLSYPWRMSKIVRQFATSEASLRRLLAKNGTSFSKILQNTRIENALGLLQGSDKSITQIANDTGFASAAHFSDSFKKRFGIPPKAIRIKEL